MQEISLIKVYLTSEACFDEVTIVEQHTDITDINDINHSKKYLLCIFLKVENDKTLAQHIYLSGFINTPALCSGLGSCGKCRVRFIENIPAPLPEDNKYFSEQDITAGWRLACHHPALSGTIILLPQNTVPSLTALRYLQAKQPTSLSASSTANPSSLPASSTANPPSTTNKSLPQAQKTPATLSIDIGTTSLHWQLIDKDAAILWQASTLNPQIGSGSDVVSRLAFAAKENGAKLLQNVMVDKIAEIIVQAENFAHVHSIVAAANPTMMALLLGISTAPLATAPYSLPHLGGTWEEIDHLPKIWLPPNLSPFVGGDISAGYAAILAQKPQFPFVLADLGTNGELLLVISEDKAICTSVALGPALEGIGLTCGTMAEPGSITKFLLTPKGLQAFFYNQDTAANTHPKGITATGYLSLLHSMLQNKALSTEGHFIENKSLQKFFTAYQQNIKNIKGIAATHGKYMPLPHGMYITARDIEEILKVKAAFSLGFKLLLEQNNIKAYELANIYIAGALGTHMHTDIFESLGFIPQGLGKKLSFAGNTALQGATILASNDQAKKSLLRWAKHVQHLDLANNSAFLNYFPAHMHFKW